MPVNMTTLAALNFTSLRQQTMVAFIRLSADPAAADELPALAMSATQTVGLQLSVSSTALHGREGEVQQAVCTGQGPVCTASVTLEAQPSVRRLQVAAATIAAAPSCDVSASNHEGTRITVRRVTEATDAASPSADAIARQVAAALGLNETLVCITSSALSISVALDEAVAGNGTALTQALLEALSGDMELPAGLVTSITYQELLPPPPPTPPAPSTPLRPPPNGVGVATGSDDSTALALGIALPLGSLFLLVLLANFWRRRRQLLPRQPRVPIGSQRGLEGVSAVPKHTTTSNTKLQGSEACAPEAPRTPDKSRKVLADSLAPDDGEESELRPDGSSAQHASPRGRFPMAASARVHPEVGLPPSSGGGADECMFSAISRVSMAASTIRTMQTVPKKPNRPAPVLSQQQQHSARPRRAESDKTHLRPRPSPHAGAASAYSSLAPQTPGLARAATMRTLASGSTMFDDGRYLDAVMRQAKSVGWLAPQHPTSDAPPLLRRLTKMALSAKPIDSRLTEGSDGGGGVRVVPMHLGLSTPSFYETMVKHFVDHATSTDQ